MTTTTKLAKLVALAALLAGASAARATPAVITYSGFLTDSAGNAVTATTSLTFRFYSADIGGIEFGHHAVTLTSGANLSADGYFSVVLGGPGYVVNSGQPGFSEMFAGTVYMGISYPGEAEMTPRIALTSVPAALAVDWAHVSGRPTGLACTQGQFQIGEDMNANPICAATPLGISCAPNQVLKWSGTAWSCGDDIDTNSVTTVQSPLTLSAGTLAIPQATGTVSGYLYSGDWKDFSGKQGRTVLPTCAAGQYLRSLAADGTPTCVTDNLGTITGVTAGAGLTGGGTTGNVTVSPNFTLGGGTNGTATTVARGDHVHYPLFTAIDTLCALTLATVTTTLTKVADLGAFTKQAAGTPVEIMWSSPVEAGAITGNNGIFLYLRVDGVAPVNNGRGNYFLQQVPNKQQVVIHGVFTGLAAGTHTAQIWAAVAVGSATNLILNGGCWGAEVVVREN